MGFYIRVMLLMYLFSVNVVWAQEPDLFNLSKEPDVLVPDIPRTEIVVPKIDEEDFELSAYVGVLSIEDFGANFLYGGRLAVHATDRWFIEASVGYSEVTDETFYRSGLHLFGDKRTRPISLFDAVVGLNVFHGEVFLGENTAWSSSVFFVAGAGQTKLWRENYFTVVFGGGLKVLPTDWLSLRLDVRLHEYETTILGFDKFSHNVETSLGIGVFF